MRSELTREQQNVIFSDKRNILVSASAGTGKTFSMVERVLRLLTKEKKDLENFLLLTFTNDAAEEMKMRIKRELTNALLDFPELKKQIKKLPLSNISTIHSFCSELLRKYFYAINLPPKFKIIDETRATFLKNKVLTELIDDMYEKEDENFLRLSEISAEKRSDDNLMKTVLELYEYSLSFEDSEKFLSDSSMLKPTEIYEKALNDEANQIASRHLSVLKELYKYFSDGNLTALKLSCVNYIEICEDLLNRNLKEKAEYLKNKGKFPNRQSGDGELYDLYLKTITDLKYRIKKLFDGFKFQGENALHVLKNDVKTLAALTLEFKKRYDEEKRKSSSLDFSDLEHYTLELLKSEEILSELQERYDYVFVDEYQDINDIQEKIISTLAEKSNLFMVGDLKQSIYLFRQCNMNIFAKKLKEYKNDDDCEVCFLNNNFRSGNDILAFSNELFSNLMTDETGIDYASTSKFAAKDDKNAEVEIFVVNSEIKKEEQPGIIYSVENATVDDEEISLAKCEGKFIADKIKSLVGKEFFDGERVRKMEYKDICLLARATKNRQTNVIYKTLLNEGVPVKIDASDANLFDFAEVGQCVNFLAVLQNHKNDLPLLSVLKSPFFSFTDNELYAIKKTANTEYFHEAFDGVDKSHPIYPKIEKFKKTIELYREVALARGGIYALSRAIFELPFEVNVLAKEDGENRMNRVYSFIAKMDVMNEDKNLATLNSQIEYISRNSKLQGVYSVKDSDTVNLITIHKSKGLEFPVVFLINCASDFYHERAYVKTNRDLGFSLDYFDSELKTKERSLSKFAIERKNNKENFEENLRVLYVALTRAKRKLFITASMKKDGEKTGISRDVFPKIVPADIYYCKNYMQLILGGIDFENTVAKITPVDIDEYSSGAKPAAFIKNGDMQYVKDAVLSNLYYEYPFKGDTMLPTKFAASNLKKDFFAEENASYILSDAHFEERLEIGTAYHKLLEICGPFDNIETIAKNLEYCIDNLLIKPEIAPLLDLAAVNKILNLPIMNFGEVYKEKPFMLYAPASRFTPHMSEEKVLIQGIIDLLLVKDGKAVVVDYKYSNETNAEVLKSRYYSQLDTYAYAVEHVLNLKVEKRIIINLKNFDIIEL